MRNTVLKQHALGALCLALAVLSGCASMQPAPEVVMIHEPFDAAAARHLLEKGTNTIKGSGFMRQQGGTVVTCAGQTVYLIPATAYAKDRLTRLYGHPQRGFRYPSSRQLLITPDPPEYMQNIRQARCDAQGAFSLDNVADGEFFVQTSVGWYAGTVPQGGHLMALVGVGGGATVNVVLAP